MSHLPRTTLAAILVEQKKPLEIAEITLPETLDVGQVLVEFAYSGICGSQLGEIDGVKGPDKWMPHLLGHEASGHVLAVGPGVKHVKTGDTVVAHWRPSLGIEAPTPKYQWQGKTVNAGWVTTFGCAVTTGFGTVDNVARVRLGETVVVFGAGGIGLNIIQAAALAGARTIVAVDRYDNRLQLAAHCGATHTLNGDTSDAWAALPGIFGGKGPDVFIDNTGSPDVIARGYELVHGNGRVVLVGVPRKGANASLYTLPLHFGKGITGTTGGEAVPQTDIPRYMALAEARSINLRELVTEVAPLASINELMDGMRSGRTAGRCL
ncbi:MAG: dehydrogenase, partial [Alphaproteobacteria bacterium]|nr:dehydrogenase [Alphaproteobacteria bacterium]